MGGARYNTENLTVTCLENDTVPGRSRSLCRISKESRRLLDSLGITVRSDI